MDNKKIGMFIKNLRKEKNLTQEELANLIHIGREAVSKWERGINKPDKSCIQEICKIFAVTPEEVLLGRKEIKKEEQESLALDLYEDRNKKQKTTKTFIIILFIVLSLFLAYYFLNNYNSIKIYTLGYSDDDITLTNGIFVTTKENIYFYLGNVTSNKDIKSLKLYYKDKNNVEKLIFKGNDTHIMLYDKYGYDSYFNSKELKEVVANSYLEIEYENESKTIKLEYKKDFANNKIYYDNIESAVTDITTSDTKDNYKNDKIDTAKIKEIFKPNDDGYLYVKDNIEVVYFEDMGIINMRIKDGEYIEDWNYYLNNDVISYMEYKDAIKINYFNCVTDNCSNNKEKVDYFFKVINEVLN